MQLFKCKDLEELPNAHAPFYPMLCAVILLSLDASAFAAGSVGSSEICVPMIINHSIKT